MSEQQQANVASRAWFTRHEIAGAFGDAGTDIPLLVGMCLAAGLDGTSVLVVFGLLQIATGVLYRMPMPVQPLKAMAALVIAQQASAEQLYGGGFAIGLIMLGLALSGLLDRLARWVPHCVVRGVQFGLGLQLAQVALTKFVQADGVKGYGLAAVAFLITIFLLASRRYPAALFVFATGLVYAFVWKLDGSDLVSSIAFRLPTVQAISLDAVLSGLVVLALPQLPLSLANSVLATQKLAHDLFPERKLSLRRLGCTYGLMNLVAPWFGGVPACHGSGGLAGHFAFGGRSGGSVVVYGSLLLCLGLFFGACFDQVALVFPLPMLGVVLLFEALALVWLLRDVSADRTQFPITLVVGVLAVSLPYGFVVGLLVGITLWHLRRRVHLISPDA